MQNIALWLGQEFQCKARLPVIEIKGSLLSRRESALRAISELVFSLVCWVIPQLSLLLDGEQGRPGSEEALVGPAVLPVVVPRQISHCFLM